jgi:Tol biopolymer transport system component
MLVDLRALRANTSVARPPSSRPRWLWAAATISMFAVLSFLAWRGWQVPQDSEPLRAVALTTLPGNEFAPSFSPDGNHVVFSWNRQDNQDLYIQMSGSGKPVQITTHALSDYNPAWSPGGKQIAFLRSDPPAPTGVRNRELLLTQPLGGTEQKLADVRSQNLSHPFFAYLAWSPDSKIVFATDSTGEGKPDAIFAISVATGVKTQITKPQPSVLADTSPAVSPDGSSLVFLRRTSWGAGELHLLSLTKELTATGESRRLTQASLRADHPAWTPDGKEIVFSAKGKLWRMPVRGQSTPVRIGYVGEDGFMPAISHPAGGQPARLIYVRSFADFNFWRIETSAAGAPAQGEPIALESSTKAEYHIRYSPDGRRVAFNSSRSGEREIWTSDPDGSNAKMLTSMNAQETMCPAWSWDGQTILYSSNPEGEFDLYSIPSGGGRPKRLTTHPAIDICGSFSADGQWIYFASMRSGSYQVWKMPAEGGDAEAVPITQTSGGAAQASKDGKYLYYNPPTIPAPVFRIALPDGRPEKLFDGMVWFNYSLTDRGVYYIDRPANQARLQFLDFASRKTSTVARIAGEVSAGLAASPDGKTIIFTRMDSSADDLMLVENFR